MTPSADLFVIGLLLVAAGGKLWLLQLLSRRSAQRRERERMAQTPIDPAPGHQQTQDLRRRMGL